MEAGSAGLQIRRHICIVATDQGQGGKAIPMDARSYRPHLRTRRHYRYRRRQNDSASRSKKLQFQEDTFHHQGNTGYQIQKCHQKQSDHVSGIQIGISVPIRQGHFLFKGD